MPTKKEFEEYARGLNPIDDLMFSKMAESREFCEEILRVILDDDELIVTGIYLNARWKICKGVL